jgi:hypothetical protein
MALRSCFNKCELLTNPPYPPVRASFPSPAWRGRVPRRGGRGRPLSGAKRRELFLWRVPCRNRRGKHPALRAAWIPPSPGLRPPSPPYGGRGEREGGTAALRGKRESNSSLSDVLGRADCISKTASKSPVPLSTSPCRATALSAARRKRHERFRNGMMYHSYQ